LFNPKLDVKILDIRKNKFRKIFEQGYKDGLSKLAKFLKNEEG
jgi:hypothetical protein